VDADFAQYENLADVSLKQLVVTGVNPRPVKNPHQLACFEPAIHSVNDRVLHLARPGSYKPNPWGLYDIHGNVSEWTRSLYKPYPYDEGDGRNSMDDGMAERVARGGSWYDRPLRARSAFRARGTIALSARAPRSGRSTPGGSGSTTSASA
jgi:hypothetical protein